MLIFTDRLPLPHTAAPLLQTAPLSPQSGVRGLEQVRPGPAVAGEPAMMMLVGMALVAVTMMRRWQRASPRLDAVTRRARAEVIRNRALVQR
ncbi:hypothetical protein ACFOMD_11595 [Sphingoaurantiacus capsulatus]|uniref:PEP-CTERM sorting domain-containing protein n=1 Tax=Sphingoaurantiacus capsulatus TaxID=1771310 RepID=A0ABV7XAQ4_9SPHN